MENMMKKHKKYIWNFVYWMNMMYLSGQQF